MQRGSLSVRASWHVTVGNYGFHKLECAWFVPMANQQGQRYEKIRCECGNTYNQHDAARRVRHQGRSDRARVRDTIVDENLQDIVCIKTSHKVVRPCNCASDTVANTPLLNRANKSRSTFYTHSHSSVVGSNFTSDVQVPPNRMLRDPEFFKRELQNHAIVRDEHNSEASKNVEGQCYCHSIATDIPTPRIPWSIEKAFNESSTDSYGKINFRQKHRKPAKYIRLSSRDDIDDVYRFVTSEWRIMEPNRPELVINVCGGQKTFHLPKKTKTRLHQAIIKVSESTSAWLVTCGLKMGVTSFIGQAVLDGQTYSVIDGAAYHNIKCIGVAPWGKVANSHQLQLNGTQTSLQGTKMQIYEAPYRVYQMSSRDFKPVSLDPNHTHFILVDNGYRNMLTGLGSIRHFHFALLQKLRSENMNVVTVVVGGGAHVLEEVLQSIVTGLPVVICEGTHRAADILADAYHHTDENGELKEDYINGNLKYQVEWMRPKWDEISKKRCLDNVVECCKSKHMMTLFDVRKHENLEEAILQAFIKCQNEGQDCYTYLQLAYACHQADFAETELLKDTQHMSMHRLNNLLQKAIIDDRCDFVRLLLRDHVDLAKVLKRTTLLKLYNIVLQQRQADHLLGMLQRIKQTTDSKGKRPVRNVRISDVGATTGEVRLIYGLRDIGHLLARLISVYDKRVYSDIENGERLDHPARELFIWSILVNRMVIAKYLCEISDMTISTALVGSWLCHRMIQTQGDKLDSELLDSYTDTKAYFERTAKETLDLMSYKYPEQAERILSEALPHYNNLTCLQVAAGAHNLDFISAKACQSHMRKKWRSGIKCSVKKLLLCFVFPFLIPSAINQDDVNLVNTSASNFVTRAILYLKKFYTSPIVKYICYTITYLLFLLLFTFMTLHPVNSEVSSLHYVVMIWVFSYVCDEVHRFTLYPIPSFRWKLFEVVGLMRTAYLLSPIACFIAFGLHIHYGYTPSIKLAYSINMVLFYIRLLQLYTPSEYLGPKLLIIKQTLIPLFHFFMILFVYSLAYGVASFASMYPSVEATQQSTREAFSQIIMSPYWHIYGELMLDNLKSDEKCYESYNVTSAQISSGLGIPCRTHSLFVVIMLAIYLFFGNVLLLNLIIAIFSQIFTDIQQNSRDYWRFLMYTFITEYDIKSALPPPISLVEYVIRGVVYAICSSSGTNKPKGSDDEDCVLRWVEEEMSRHYVREKNRNSDTHILNICNNINERVDDLASNLKKVEKFVVEIGGTELQLRDIKAAISSMTMPTIHRVDDDTDDRQRSRRHRRRRQALKNDSPVTLRRSREKPHTFRDTVVKYLTRSRHAEETSKTRASFNSLENSSSSCFNTIEDNDDDTTSSNESDVDGLVATTVWYTNDVEMAETSFIHDDGHIADDDSLHNLIADDDDTQ